MEPAQDVQMHDDEELQKQALRNEFSLFLGKAKALFEQDPSMVTKLSSNSVVIDPAKSEIPESE